MRKISHLTLPVYEDHLSSRRGIYSMRSVTEPSPLPRLCPRCGEAGTAKEELRVSEPLPRKFWVMLAGLLLSPVFFGLKAVTAATFLGAEALDAYLKFEAFTTGLVAIFSVLWMARSAAACGEIGLIFRFCAACARQYCRLRRGFSALTSATVLLFAALLFSPLLWVGAGGREEAIRPLLVGQLGLFAICVTALVALGIAARRFPGLSAQWVRAQSAITLRFRNPQVAENVRKGL